METDSQNAELCCSSEDAPLKVGDRYLVRRPNNLLYPANILKIRQNQQKCIEYYVHYKGFDRRLDQWVPRDKFDIPENTRGQKDSNKDVNLFNQIGRKITRNQKRKLDEIHALMSDAPMESPMVSLENEFEKLTKIKHIEKIQLGQYEIDTWYFSPYPKEYQKKKIWVCEYCFKYSQLEKSLAYHMCHCERKQPPGVEVYHKESLSIWEVDASQYKLYCQNLCLLAKLFLDHKTLYFDIKYFLFYILCKIDKFGAHLVGYFSKEKNPSECNNVACILTMPPFQRQGFGKLLIAFSYELSKLEGLAAGPEKPLSDFGKLSYQSYWSWILLDILINTSGPLLIQDLSTMTSITQMDIISTLKSMGLVKYWKGQHSVCSTPTYIKQLVNSGHYKRPKLILDRSIIKWTPKCTILNQEPPGNQIKTSIGWLIKLNTDPFILPC